MNEEKHGVVAVSRSCPDQLRPGVQVPGGGQLQLPARAFLCDKQGMAQTKKNAAAVALGRLGGLKGGKARARKLTAEQRRRSARKAARARWSREKS